MMGTELCELEGWTYRVRLPEGGAAPRVILLLHGWLGNEDVMWVFASRLPRGALVFAPRAIYAAPGGGFSWVDRRSSAFSTLEEFRPAVGALENLLGLLQPRYAGDFSQVDLIGFSQGAALAFSWMATLPGRVRSAAGLAGFVPEGIGGLAGGRPFEGKRVFMAHGSADGIVPPALARAGRETLEAGGARVEFCEEAVGHKVGAGCGRRLGEFFGQAN